MLLRSQKLALRVVSGCQRECLRRMRVYTARPAQFVGLLSAHSLAVQGPATSTAFWGTLSSWSTKKAAPAATLTANQGSGEGTTSWLRAAATGTAGAAALWLATDRASGPGSLVSRVHAQGSSGSVDQGLTEDEKRMIQIYESSSRSVLNVTNLRGRRNLFGHNTLEVPQGTGSGFVWDDAGHIVTNFHVVQGASNVMVTTADHTEVECALVGADPSRDIAVFKAKPRKEDVGLKPLPLGSSSTLKVGQRAITIGNPFGLDLTFTTGVVSALGRELPAMTGRPIANMIQTDAAINPGSSGGPLLDSSGRVIGMNTMIFSPSGASAGIGFATPIDALKLSVSQIIKYGRPIQPGIGLQLAPDQFLKSRGIEGALVVGVTSDEAKDIFRETYQDRRGRLVLGDIIVKINNTEVASSIDVYRAFEGVTVGDSLEVTFLRPNGRRNGRSLEVEEHTARLTAQDISVSPVNSKL